MGSGLISCSQDEEVAPNPLVFNPPVEEFFNINAIRNTYAANAPYVFLSKRGSYTTNNPSIWKEGDYFYCYSTDVSLYAETWTFQAPWLELKWSNGQTENVYVERGRD